jgi:pimeloyl-ACP methyl ester carboxylesterase
MGQKPLIIILPGWGGTHETWREFMVEAAKQDVDTHCIDLPCFGDAPCPDRAWGVEDYMMYVVSAVEVLKEKMPARPFVLLGHSFGGQVAVITAAKHANLFSGLILSGAAIFRPDRTVKRTFFAIVAKTGKWIFRLPLLERIGGTARKILYQAAHSPDYANTSGIKRDIFKKVIRQDVSLYLPSIRTKTLILWGKKDAYVSVHDSKRIKDLLPHALIHVFPNAGHGLHLNRSKDMIVVIKEYLSTL